MDEPMSLEEARRMFEQQVPVALTPVMPATHELSAQITRLGDVSRDSGGLVSPEVPLEMAEAFQRVAEWKPISDADLSELKTWGQTWVDYALQTGPLTYREWAAWEVGARGCYAAADMPWPGRVVRVSSPDVGSIAAPMASWWLRNRWRWTVPTSKGPAKPRSIRDTVEAVVARFRETADIVDDVTAAIQAAIGHNPYNPYVNLTDEMMSLPHFFTEHGSEPLDEPAIKRAEHQHEWMPPADYMAHRVGLIERRVHDELRGTVRGDLLKVVNEALGVIDENLAPLNRRLPIRQSNSRANITCSGRFAIRKHATWSFFRDVLGMELANEAWAFSRVLQAAESAGPWWAFPEVVMVCDRPSHIGLESTVQTSNGWGPSRTVRRWRTFRLHSEDGPALGWPDGQGIWAWHGTVIPKSIYEHPTLEDALELRNAEQRRAAFEIMGWDQVIASLDVEPIDRCPDPGNAPHELLLYELPDAVNPFRMRGRSTSVNLLLMTNGSPDRSGALRQYGETVPAEIRTALEAASWQYGVSPKVYAQIKRRT